MKKDHDKHHQEKIPKPRELKFETLTNMAIESFSKKDPRSKEEIEQVFSNVIHLFISFAVKRQVDIEIGDFLIFKATGDIVEGPRLKKRGVKIIDE